MKKIDRFLLAGLMAREAHMRQPPNARRAWLWHLAGELLVTAMLWFSLGYMGQLVLLGGADAWLVAGAVIGSMGQTCIYEYLAWRRYCAEAEWYDLTNKRAK